MCIDCWRDDYGAPRLVNAKIVKAVELIHRVYEGWDSDPDWFQGYLDTLPEDADVPCEWFHGFPGHGTGGNLHVQLDDWDLEGFAGEFRVYLSEPPHQLAVQHACYDHMRTMTDEERASALGWYNGYIPENIPGAPPQRTWLVR